MNFPGNSNACDFSFPFTHVFECIPNFFSHGWWCPSSVIINPMNRDVALFYAVPWPELILCRQVSLLHFMRYVVLTNRNFQCKSLNPIVASLASFSVEEDRLVLFLFQRNSVTNVPKRWPFMVISWGAPQGLCERPGIKMTACFFLAGLLSHFLEKQTITPDEKQNEAVQANKTTPLGSPESGYSTLPVS